MGIKKITIGNGRIATFVTKIEGADLRTICMIDSGEEHPIGQRHDLTLDSFSPQQWHENGVILEFLNPDAAESFAHHILQMVDNWEESILNPEPKPENE